MNRNLGKRAGPAESSERYMFNDPKEADAIVDGPIGKKLFDLLPPKGLIGLGYWELGFRNVTNSKRPLAKLEDFSGLKLRVLQSPLFIDTFSALASNPVPMPFPEVYTALEQKVVDGQENPITVIVDSKFQEVQKYLSLTKHIYNPQAVIMVPINIGYTPREMGYVVGDAEAQFLVIDEDRLDTLAALPDRPAALTDDRVFVVGTPRGAQRRWDALLDRRSASVPSNAVDCDDLMNIQYTSGTTGFPKGCMRRVDAGLLLAAEGLGATPWKIFQRIYLPLTLPGVLAGTTLVFILSIGFYITPALLGGGRVLMIAVLIEKQVREFLDWGFAAALSMVLLGAALAVYAAFRKLMKSDLQWS